MASLAITSRSFSKHPLLRKEVLRIYPDAIFNDRGVSLEGNSLIDFLKGSQKAITALETIDESVLCKLPDLKIISKYGVGLDMIDLFAMEQHNVKLAWKGGINKRSVSELVLSSAISLLHRSIFANSEVRKNKWYQIKGRQLSSATFGIIGCGNIGKDLIKLLQPFNCKILVNDIQDYPDYFKLYNIKNVSIENLVSNSDIISLHLPLNESTKNIINKEKIKKFKKDSILINYARGGLIDEDALKESLLLKNISGAALDVFEIEPPIKNEFSNMDNVIVTPHIGGSTEEAILAMGLAAIKGLENPSNPINYI